MSSSKNKKPKPKPRKLGALWQAYQWWYELMEIRKRHNLRIQAIERGDSEMNAAFERNMMDLIGSQTKEIQNLDGLVEFARKVMIEQGQAIGPIWDWATGIKGLGTGNLAAQLFAQIDDISLSPTVSALWRFAGFAVIDGKPERNQRGEKSHFNRRLKGICWNISDQFIKQNTPVYRDIYDDEKARQYELYPEPICSKCGAKAIQKGNKWRCQESASHRPILYTPAHLHNRAWRKMIKIFLQHLWVEWRTSEGLPITLPYAHGILGHTELILPDGQVSLLNTIEHR